MNVVTPHGHDLRGASGALSSPAVHPMLDRAVLATGAAERRARAAATEADIDHACEAAALRPDLCSSTATCRDRDRRSWGGRTWNRYVAEAVRQAQAHAAELERLRREAAQLDRLLQVSRSPDGRPTTGAIAPL